MTNIGCLTFHAAHNYGSVLQAYALQQYISKEFNCKYEIINYRSNIQKKLYKIISSKNSIYRNLYNLVYFIKIYKKNIKFENFIKTELILSPYFSEPVKEELDNYDLIIVGGDQPWNLSCIDYNPFYFIPYKITGRKISFAISMGGFNTFNDEIDKFLSEALNDYEALSVREVDTRRKLLKYVSGIEIHCDPVFLLNKEEWKSLFKKKERVNKKKYIFVYMLKIDIEIYKKIINFAKINDLDIIIPRPICLMDIFYGVKRKYDIGPYDFLFYLYNAEYVFTSSFHGCAFSAIFEKKFFAINGRNDIRINFFLNQNKLENRSINNTTDFSVLPNIKLSFETFTNNVYRNRQIVKNYFSRFIL